MLETEDSIAGDPAGRYRQYDSFQRKVVSGHYYPRNGMTSLADVVLSANNGVMPPDKAGVLAALDTAAATEAMSAACWPMTTRTPSSP